MLTKRLTTLALTMLLPGSLSCLAQDSLLLRDYMYVKQSDPWLTSANAAALPRYARQNLSVAELSVTKEKGGLTNYDGSPDVLQADAAIESFFRLSQHTVVFGSMSYNNFSGKEMGGSALSPLPSPLSPLTSKLPHRPFDLVEDSLGNEGRKHCDTYHLAGGFGSTLAGDFAVGARLDYTAANYAKYKDLRHQNKLMDLQLSAGFYLPIGSHLQVGANYLYHRNTESLSFSTYGKSDRVYVSLVDYAAFMGHTEQFGSDGYTDKSREMPLVSDCNGVGVQASLQTKPIAAYADFTYAHRRGYYGRKSPYTITYANHASDIYQAHARLSHQSRRSVYHIDLSLDIENLQNDAATYRELKNEASATYYEYYTPVKTANKLWISGSAMLTAHLGLRHELPTWTLCAGLNWARRQQTAYVFPYSRRQELNCYEGVATITRNLPTRQGVWSLSLGGTFQQGSGQPYEDLTLQSPSDKQQAPATMEAYLYREYRYLTAAQYSIAGSIKYAFLLTGTAIRPHVALSLSHRKANETNAYSLGCDRIYARLAVGCSF